MRTGDVLRLLALAAIWGSSFIFLRLLSPVLGPAITASARLIIAGGLLVFYLMFFKKLHFSWKAHWRHYLLIGIINSAIPFFLFSYAAINLPASFSVILNSTSPLFGAIFSALWLADALTPQKIFGLTLGFFGVALIGTKGQSMAVGGQWLSILACLVGSSCYGMTGVYIKKFAKKLKPMPIAASSQLFAGLALAPMIYASPLRQTPTPEVISYLLILALMCTAIAYILYFRLINDVGPTKALTVTFLMPVFGILWSVIFLNEKVNASMFIGGVLIILGTATVLIQKPALNIRS